MLNKWKADFPGMPVHGEQGILCRAFYPCPRKSTSCSAAAGVFLQNNSISSTHAVVCKYISNASYASVLASSFSPALFADLESAGAVCWIKDLGSRNKVSDLLHLLLLLQVYMQTGTCMTVFRTACYPKQCACFCRPCWDEQVDLLFCSPKETDTLFCQGTS